MPLAEKLTKVPSACLSTKLAASVKLGRTTLSITSLDHSTYYTIILNA